MRLRILKLLALTTTCVIVGATAAVAAGPSPFEDVPEDHFAKAAIDWAYEHGVTQGTSATTFSPERAITRAEGVTFLDRYNTNVVQPALVDLQESIAEQKARIDEQIARIDDLEPGEPAAVEPGIGPIEMSHGGPTGNDFGTRVRYGESRISLAGPMSIDGAAYELASVRYCIADASGSRPIDSVAVYGVGADGPQQLAIDETDRTEDGCYDLAVGSSLGSFVLTLDVGWGCYLDLYGVTSVWVPVG